MIPTFTWGINYLVQLQKKSSIVVYEAAELIPDIVAGTIYLVQWVSMYYYYSSKVFDKKKNNIESLNAVQINDQFYLLHT